MKKSYLLCFALSIIGSSVLAQNSEEKASLYKYAVEMFNESKFDMVIKNCDAIAIRGGDAETYKLRAKAYRALGDFNNAIKDYGNAISGYILQHGKKEPTLYFDRGMLYMCQKKFDLALADFNDARRLFRQTGKENFLYLEEIGRCSHYREENKSAIETFKLAMQLGSFNPSTYINLASSYFYNNSFNELKSFTDSLLTTEIYDSAYYYYVYALNDIASNSVNTITLERINSGIKTYRSSNQICYQGEYFDMFYARAYIYSFLEKDSAAYEDYRAVAKNNNWLKSVKARANELKLKLGIDIIPPSITLRNPQVDIDNKAIVKATKRKYQFFAQATDSSGIQLISVTSNDRDLPPITSIEAGGIFEFSIDLNPGNNKIVINAVDKYENTISKTFLVDFEERVQTKTIVTDSAFADDIPDLNNNVNFYALLIAEKDYDDEGFKDLQTPIDDASEVGNILINQYDFAESNVKLLTNATRQMITDTLSALCKMMTDADNLLIFYAGHGDEKRTNGEIVGGYIIPSDAKKDNRATYISNQDLVEPVLNTQARHVLFVVDACFAGLMRATMDDAPQGIKNLYNNKSRRILTSGNREQVPDGGQFIFNFKNYLRNPGRVYLTANDLYNYIVDNNRSSNTPIYERISNAGDVSIGHFILKKVR